MPTTVAESQREYVQGIKRNIKIRGLTADDFRYIADVLDADVWTRRFHNLLVQLIGDGRKEAQ